MSARSELTGAPMGTGAAQRSSMLLRVEIQRSESWNGLVPGGRGIPPGRVEDRISSRPSELTVGVLSEKPAEFSSATG